MINRHLLRVCTWAQEHALLFNPQRTIDLLLGTEQQISYVKNEGYVGKIHKTTMPYVNAVQNLGVMMEGRWRFEEHVRKR